jgi:hypothetical protein
MMNGPFVMNGPLRFVTVDQHWSVIAREIEDGFWRAIYRCINIAYWSLHTVEMPSKSQQNRPV